MEKTIDKTSPYGFVFKGEANWTNAAENVMKLYCKNGKNPLQTGTVIDVTIGDDGKISFIKLLNMPEKKQNIIVPNESMRDLKDSDREAMTTRRCAVIQATQIICASESVKNMKLDNEHYKLIGDAIEELSARIYATMYPKF